MTSLRKTSLVAGVLYLITFVSIPTLALFAPALAPGYLTGPGPDTPVLIGGVLEVIVALAGIGTALALYPVVRRQNEGLALGFVAARTLEAALIFVGVVTLLAVVTLRQAGVGADGAITAQALVALREWTTLLGQGFIPAMNALLLGTLLYRSRLVPRILPLVGLVGAPLLVASDIGVLFGFWEPVSTVTGLAVIPIALWELSLGVWLVAKGFRPSPITAGLTASADRVSL
ncbi:DUF4386 domain-containing protein [Cryobacterium frigoriphilum]|uniref:DUF4386 domain-containing protein n=2 Tax=Cryobacterium frigoriphilum TaxID=1259150 RepID=A0A4R8ZV44_9MICO|nr:DUF4386 domain-containing protein [Cryobacterium frigoriphilum]